MISYYLMEYEVKYLRVEQLEDFYSVTLFSLKINKLTRINFTTVTR